MLVVAWRFLLGSLTAAQGAVCLYMLAQALALEAL